MAYYNTNKEAGNTLKLSWKKAESQEMAIYDFFKQRQGEMFTPFDIQRMVLPHSPVTSVRRAMTNLTNDGKLLKTTHQKPGVFGKMNFCWTLKTTLF